MNPSRRTLLSQSPGFTLVELVVSVAIIGLMMLVLVSMTNQISETWRSTTGKIEEFQQARNGFESMTRKLAQATLNTHWDMVYATVNGRPNPTDFRRNSELRFVSGPMLPWPQGLSPGGATFVTHGVFFQAPLGYVDQVNVTDMENLVNTWGYFVQVVDDTANVPPFLAPLVASGQVPNHTRTRLMELMEPTEYMSVYNLDANRHDASINPAPTTSPLSPNQAMLSWFQTVHNPASGSAVTLGQAGAPVRVLADNIVALIVWPRLAKQDEDARLGYTGGAQSVLSPNYTYDSSTQSFFSTVTAGVNTFYLNPGAGVLASADPAQSIELGGINPKHQLPPVLQVTMVAIDAVSAQRVVDKTGSKTALTQFANGLFTGTTPHEACAFGTALGQQTGYDRDLATLEQRLAQPAAVDPRIGTGALKYRIFSENVVIRGAKWSTAQTH